jgi:cell division transport system permease protein
MTLTFLVTGLFVLLSFGSSIVLKYFEQKPQITIFFKDIKKEADIKALSEKLKTNEKVAGVKYISKDEALNIYKEQFKKDPILLEMVSSDILPASLEISATKIEYLSDIATMLKAEPDLEDVVYQQDVVDLLVAWTRTIRTIGLLLVVFLGVVALFTIVTVISMKIALKRKEIEILQLVGASSWYIKAPFILEGGFYGMIGAFIGWVINMGVLLYATPFLSTLFVGIPLFPIQPLFYFLFLLCMLGVGLLLGLSASSLALARYLR